MAFPVSVLKIADAHAEERDLWRAERRRLEAQISRLESEIASRDEVIAQMRRSADLRDAIDRARRERIEDR